MRHLLTEIERCVELELYSTAVSCALTIPDACGGVDFPRRGNGERYKAWCEEWLEASPGDRYGKNVSEMLYKLRCNLSHEIRLNKRSGTADRVKITAHPNRGMHHIYVEDDEGRTLYLSAPILCHEIILGANRWLDSIADNAIKTGRVDKLLQYRPASISGFVVGVPVLA